MSHSAKGQILNWLLAKIAQQMRLSPDKCDNSWTAPSAETNAGNMGKVPSSSMMRAWFR